MIFRKEYAQLSGLFIYFLRGKNSYLAAVHLFLCLGNRSCVALPPASLQSLKMNKNPVQLGIFILGYRLTTRYDVSMTGILPIFFCQILGAI